MLIGNINTIPSIVNLPGQGNTTDQGTAFRFERSTGGWFESSFGSNLGAEDNLAISVWVKIDQEFFNTVGFNTDYHILDKYVNNQTGGYRLFLRNQPNGQKQLIFTGVSNVSGQRNVVLNITSLQADTPYLITADTVGFVPQPQLIQGCLRVKGEGVSLSANQSNFTRPSPSSAPPFVIANANPTQSDKGFAGVIDEIAIWPATTQIDDAGATNLFNWPVYKDLMNSNPLGNNIQPVNWFRMGENTVYDPVHQNWVMPNAGTDNSTAVLKSDGSPAPAKVNGIPNELYA
tara:strand:+ start:129 stop:995 length:867 start_codon:yes stop_codon:yes gene_type:complete